MQSTILKKDRAKRFWRTKDERNETLTYVDNLNKAGVPAKVDVYPTGFHAFDLLLPFRKISRQAARAFDAQYRKRMEEVLK